MKNMKIYKRLAFLLILTTVFFSCKAQSQLQQINNYNSLIVGSWVSEDDQTYKIEFTGNGIQKEYINNELQDETYNYIIVSSCGTNANNSFDIYLKRFEDSNNFVCDIINNIYTDENDEVTLSITTERGQLETYIKE